jgi:hypothetical protein
MRTVIFKVRYRSTAMRSKSFNTLEDALEFATEQANNSNLYAVETITTESVEVGNAKRPHRRAANVNT